MNHLPGLGKNTARAGSFSDDDDDHVDENGDFCSAVTQHRPLQGCLDVLYTQLKIDIYMIFLLLRVLTTWNRKLLTSEHRHLTLQVR